MMWNRLHIVTNPQKILRQWNLWCDFNRLFCQHSTTAPVRSEKQYQRPNPISYFYPFQTESKGVVVETFPNKRDNPLRPWFIMSCPRWHLYGQTTMAIMVLSQWHLPSDGDRKAWMLVICSQLKFPAINWSNKSSNTKEYGFINLHGTVMHKSKITIMLASLLAINNTIY